MKRAPPGSGSVRWRDISPNPRKPWQAWLFTVVVTSLTFLLRVAFDESLDRRPTLIVFIVPIMLSAYVGGLWCGLLSTALSYFASSYYLLPPTKSFAIASAAERWQQFFLVLVGTFVSLLSERLHRTRDRAETAARTAEQAEKQAKESGARYWTLFQSAPDGLTILNPKGFHIDVNPRMCEMLGYRREEYIGLNSADLVAPEEIPRIEPAMGRLEAGEPYRDQWLFRRKDGSLVEAEVVATKMPDGNFLGITHDLTRRRQAELALQEKHRQLREVLDSLSIFVALFSTDGIILEANRAPLEAINLKREEVLGRPLVETPPWSYSPAVQARLRDAIARAARGEVVQYDEVLRLADNKSMIMNAIFSPLRDAHGQITQIVGSGADVTDRQKMEADLLASRGELRALATNLRTAREQEATRISREIHDQLGQALTGLQMDVSAVRRDLERPGSVDEPEAVLKKLDAMAKAIDETLQTARRVAAQLRPAILDELGLTAAIEWQAREFEQRSSIFCNLILPSNEPELDPERATAVFRILQEVLTNVTRHAKATEVSIEMRVAGEAVRLEMRDNGVGIEDIELARVHGLGLLGMQERAIAAGLELEVQSGPGQGTAVIVEIPLGGPA